MGQTPRSRSQGQNNGTRGKEFSQEIFMLNIKALVPTVQKLLARLKFQRGGQNDRRTKTICPPIFDLRGHIKHLLHYWQLKKKYKSLTRMLQYKGCITPMKQLKF